MDATSSARDRGTGLHDAMLFDQSTLPPPPPRMILPFGERPSTGRLDATGHSHSSNHNYDSRPKTAPSNARGSILEEQRILLGDGLKRDSGFITSATKSGTASRQQIDTDGDAAQTPSLPTPTIVVHDADNSHRLPTLERLISPFVRRRSHDTGRAPPPKLAEPQRPTT